MKCLVLLKLSMPCFFNILGRPVPEETEEECMGEGEMRTGEEWIGAGKRGMEEGLGGEEGEETAH